MTNLHRVDAEERARLDATELIAEALAEAGRSSRDLAAVLGVRHRRVVRWMRGQALTVTDLAAVLDALDYDLVLIKHPKLPTPYDGAPVLP